jgi:hypothetical protein
LVSWAVSCSKERGSEVLHQGQMVFPT